MFHQTGARVKKALVLDLESLVDFDVLSIEVFRGHTGLGLGALVPDHLWPKGENQNLNVDLGTQPGASTAGKSQAEYMPSYGYL